MDLNRLAEIEQRLAYVDTMSQERLDALWLIENVRQLVREIHAEHSRSNGSSAYMDMPQHEKTIRQCKHPLCVNLLSAEK